jgi:selenocysteine lyase/cysteine desulfurase
MSHVTQDKWIKLRKQYPITENKVYLKNASISGMHSKVIKRSHEWNHSIACEGAVNEQRFGDLVFAARDTVAHYLNIPNVESVTLTENTSHNFNLLAIMLKEQFPKGAHILAPADEFPSSILPFYHHGHHITQFSSHQGVIDEDEFINRITDQTHVVICSHVQFSTGFRIDIERIARECEKRGVYFFLNATQSIGVFPIDLEKLKVTALSATCHKWLGAGMGRAVFYLNREFMKEHNPPLLGWCSVAEPFEMKNTPGVAREDLGIYQLGTLPFTQLAAVKEALAVNLEIGREEIETRILQLANILRSEINELGLPIVGAQRKENQSGIITFDPQCNPDDLIEFLEERRIYVNNRRGLIRASIHFYNNEEDINLFISALKDFKHR